MGERVYFDCFEWFAVLRRSRADWPSFVAFLCFFYLYMQASVWRKEGGKVRRERSVIGPRRQLSSNLGVSGALEKRAERKTAASGALRSHRSVTHLGKCLCGSDQ